KIVCVGVNYEEHRQETGRDKTEQPALFLRLAESQVGHRQPILRPRESKNLDYEAEIAVVIGRAGRRISQKDSWNHIAGYSCYNDGSVRDWQRHTIQWTAGKNFASTGGFGPWMVTADEIPAATLLTLSCRHTPCAARARRGSDEIPGGRTRRRARSALVNGDRRARRARARPSRIAARADRICLHPRQPCAHDAA